MSRTLTDLLAILVPDVNGCMVWPLCKDKPGYGKFYFQGRTRFVHRVVYELANGPIPAGMHVDHTCFVRACANPAHLRLLPAAENAGRQRRTFAPTCKHGHPWTPENTYRGPGRSGRACRACNAIAVARYKVRRAAA